MQVRAQCCAGCSPIGGNLSQGILQKGSIQINTFARYALSSGYDTLDMPSNFKFIKNGYSTYGGFQFSYGLTKRLTIDFLTGYYFNRVQNFSFIVAGEPFNYTYNGVGVSNFNLSFRYNVYLDTVHDFEITLGGGYKSPWGNSNLASNAGVTLPIDVQPCNGASAILLKSFIYKKFDRANTTLFLVNNFTYNFYNKYFYKESNVFSTALFISYPISKVLSGILQLRNDVRGYSYSDEKLQTSTGGYKFLIIPQLNYNIKGVYNLSVLYEYPFYQYFHGTQLKDIYAASINLTIRIPGKSNKICAKPY
ncbi:MAG: hypothetical protein JSU07_02740 [Bacteroidetes bacterium]|nr:hypothetical protein [Bacteroidota bacterium]